MKNFLLLPLTVMAIGLTACVGVVPAPAGSVALHDRRDATAIADDRTIRSAIINRLRASREIQAFSHINVNVFNRVALITGEAANQITIDNIVNTAHAIPNVKRIESDIFIGPKSTFLNRTNDTVITGKVKTALMSLRQPNFDPSLIRVVTERSNVYLMGIVTTAEAEAIAKRASQVAGVRSVTKVFDVVGVNY